jgi:hypothetical protein
VAFGQFWHGICSRPAYRFASMRLVAHPRGSTMEARGQEPGRKCAKTTVGPSRAEFN